MRRTNFLHVVLCAFILLTYVEIGRSQDTITAIAIDDEGNVGIGTDTPQALLHVGNEMNFGRTTLGIMQRPTDNVALSIRNNLIARGDPNEGRATLQFCTKDYINGTQTKCETIYIDRSGALNIGGSEKPPLKVNIYNEKPLGSDMIGRVQMFGLPVGDSSEDTEWPLYINEETGVVYSKHSHSSKKYKKNIEPLKDDFSMLLNASPITYEDKETGEKSIGYTAEDFNKLGLKHLVGYNKNNKPFTIHYSRLPVYIVEILKQQQTQIDALSKELTEIKKVLAEADTE